jgi:hypothetical protein
VGFRLKKENNHSPEDTLLVYEVKASFSSSKNSLQDAVNDSAKDEIRIAETLNFIKRKLHSQDSLEDMKKIGRFQNPEDKPFQEIYGAALVVSNKFYNQEELTLTDCTSIPASKKYIDSVHPKIDKLLLLVIKGSNMMRLAHNLYKRAADEA